MRIEHLSFYHEPDPTPAVLYPNWPSRGQEPHRARGEAGNLADHNRVGARVADAPGEAHAAARAVGRVMPRGADVA